MSDYFDVTRDNVLRYDPETITIPAGETREVPGNVSYVEILSATADAVSVSLNGRYFFPLDIGLVIKAPQGKGFRRVFLKNNSGASNTIKVAKGLGDFVDGRLVISSTSIIKTDPVPTPYSTRFAFSSSLGSASTNTTIVTGGANTNGLLLLAASLTTGNDPLAVCELLDNIGVWYAVQDSQCLALPCPITIAAGNQLQLFTQGRCLFACAYRLL